MAKEFPTQGNAKMNDKNELLVDTNEAIAKKILETSSDTYVAEAPAGTSQSAAAWRCYKITTSGEVTTITWADGDTEYDNVASELNTLSYS